MKTTFTGLKRFTAVGLAVVGLPALSSAHCDSMDGPVIGQAREALAAGDVTPTLKWVPAEHEDAIREAFDQVLRVRAAGGEAAELADRYFFETLVRIHREGEGAAYTGLRPTGDLEPIYAAADQALVDGSADHLAEHLAETVKTTIKERFATASEALKTAETDLDAGRDYVVTYVEYMHFVEAINEMLTHTGGHHPGHAH